MATIDLTMVLDLIKPVAARNILVPSLSTTNCYPSFQVLVLYFP